MQQDFGTVLQVMLLTFTLVVAALVPFIVVAGGRGRRSAKATVVLDGPVLW